MKEPQIDRNFKAVGAVARKLFLLFAVIILVGFILYVAGVVELGTGLMVFFVVPAFISGIYGFGG